MLWYVSDSYYLALWFWCLLVTVFYCSYDTYKWCWLMMVSKWRCCSDDFTNWWSFFDDFTNEHDQSWQWTNGTGSRGDFSISLIVHIVGIWFLEYSLFHNNAHISTNRCSSLYAKWWLLMAIRVLLPHYWGLWFWLLMSYLSLDVNVM